MPTIVGTTVGVVALLVTTGTARSAVIGTFIAAILGLSLVVVTGFAGQVSLAQLTLAGVGGFGLAGIAQSLGVPFPVAPLLAALIACLVGIVVGLPALRLRGLTLGIVTLALAYAIEASWFRNGQFVSSSGASVTSPKLFGLDLGIGIGKAFPRMEFGLLCLLTLVAIAWGVARLRTSSLGSAMLAVRARSRLRRSSPGSAAASSRTARRSSRFSRSLRSAGSRCSRPHTSLASRRYGAGSSRGSSPARASCTSRWTRRSTSEPGSASSVASG
jgi:sulfate-transporting ATPase